MVHSTTLTYFFNSNIFCCTSTFLFMLFGCLVSDYCEDIYKIPSFFATLPPNFSELEGIWYYYYIMFLYKKILQSLKINQTYTDIR